MNLVIILFIKNTKKYAYDVEKNNKYLFLITKYQTIFILYVLVFYTFICIMKNIVCCFKIVSMKCEK